MIEAYTGPVQELLTDVTLNELRGKAYSDIWDGEEHQYVDLVMGGGGVLGIALIGYTYVLEQANIRFHRIGGVSAGAINALGMAAIGRIHEPKSETLLAELVKLEVWSFVDGPAAARRLVKDFLHNELGVWKLTNGMLTYSDFARKLGLNPGDSFRQWLVQFIGGQGISTVADLDRRLQPDAIANPKAVLRNRQTGAPVNAEESRGELAVVTTDVTTETKAVFPKMAELYWQNWKKENPASFVRASMSIPFFFEPYRVDHVPQDRDARDKWFKVVGNDHYPPHQCVFVDGGVLSNFPINLFHEPNSVPLAPTFGVQLGANRRPIASFHNVVEFTMAVFNAARHALDNDFLDHNPDYKYLICDIDTGHQSWLNFDVTEREKVELFVSGAKAAIQFLQKFDWEAYKKVREALKAANKEAKTPLGGGPAGMAGPAPPM